MYEIRQAVDRLGDTRYFKYRNDVHFHNAVRWMLEMLRDGRTCRLDLPDCCKLAIEIYEQELLLGRETPPAPA